MKVLSNIENAKPINLEDEVADFISEYTEKLWYKIVIKAQGVYKIEYSKEYVDSVSVFEKPKYFFQHSRIIDKTRNLDNKKWIELFYLEKGKTYYICLNLKTGLKYGTYSLKITPHEVPANNYRETAKKIDIVEKIKGRLDYVTDKDWFSFIAPETCDYKVIYSNQLVDALFIYCDESKTPEISLVEKVYLINNTIAEPYHLVAGKRYYIEVYHLKGRNLGNYTIKFWKIPPDKSQRGIYL